MRYRKLGNTGLKVSELCLGTMTFGAKFYNIAEVDQQGANKMVARALDEGINFFDTADVYSYGECDHRAAQALPSVDDRIAESRARIAIYFLDVSSRARSCVH